MQPRSLNKTLPQSIRSGSDAKCSHELSPTLYERSAQNREWPPGTPNWLRRRQVI